MSDPVQILYMEDNTTFATFMKRHLHQAGYAVEIAKDGVEGLKRLKQHDYVLVIIDYLMPHCDGLEVIKTLSQTQPQKMPIIIMLTGAGDEKIAVNAMKLGARDYIVKDSGREFLDLLLHAIQRLLHERQLEIEKQAAEQALIASEQRFRAVFNQTYQCMLLLQIDGTIISANDQACDMLQINVPPSQIVTQSPWFQYGSPKTQTQIIEALQQASQGHTSRFEAQFVFPHHELPMQLSLKPIRNDTGRIHMIVCEGHDISIHKAAEQGLLQAKELAEQADRSKSEFLANVSHELRTPLNAILGFSDVLKEDVKDANQQLMDDAQQIYTSAKQLNVLIDDILIFAKIEAGQMQSKIASYSLQKLITEIITILTPKTSQKPLKIRTHIDKDIPNKLIFDPIKLRHILLNLISNAIKFSHQGDININVSIANHNQQQHTLKFSIEDPGIGIDPSLLSHIFQPFTQGDGTPTRKYGGTGLGLAIVKRLLDSLNSQIHVESRLGKGSIFQFEIKFDNS